MRKGRGEVGGARAEGRQRRLARILGAAEELFAAQGFAKTTVDEIAGLAGVSKGLLYDHYASKEDLLSAVWERLVDAWTDAVRHTKYGEGSVADAIGEMMRVSLDYVRANPLLRRIIALDPGSLVPGGLAGQLEFGRKYRASLEPILAHGVRTGELRRGLDVPHAAEMVWLIHFTLTRELFVARGRERADAEELLRSAVDLVVAGLRASGGSRRWPGRGSRGV
ncbi:MAG TPA: TetR/AcrR family transcriptional regulator [Myxococcota bacterium]|nr:TetR/AcrR family transcriptional regulator [Myxococcota bacterium]